MMSQLGPPEAEPESLDLLGLEHTQSQKTYPGTKGFQTNLIEIQHQNPRPSTCVFCRFGIAEMANIGLSTPMGLESVCLPQPFPIASVLYEASRATCKLDVASEAGLGWLLVLA